MNKEILKGTVDILILSVLEKGDNYGYEISKIIKSKTSGTFEMIEATMYLSLKRLEKHLLIASYLGNESGGGQRKYFKLTQDGVERLNELKIDWIKTVEIVNRFI